MCGVRALERKRVEFNNRIASMQVSTTLHYYSRFIVQPAGTSRTSIVTPHRMSSCHLTYPPPESHLAVNNAESFRTPSLITRSAWCVCGVWGWCTTQIWRRSAVSQAFFSRQHVVVVDIFPPIFRWKHTHKPPRRHSRWRSSREMEVVGLRVLFKNIQANCKRRT